MKTIKILNVTIEYNNANVRIIDSYKVTDRVKMLAILIEFKRETKFESKRTIQSWLKEWKSHNRLYKLGLFRSHTRDCDLEENEKLHRLMAYEILGI